MTSEKEEPHTVAAGGVPITAHDTGNVTALAAGTQEPHGLVPARWPARADSGSLLHFAPKSIWWTKARSRGDRSNASRADVAAARDRARSDKGLRSPKRQPQSPRSKVGASVAEANGRDFR